MKRFRAWLTAYLEVEDILLEVIFGLLIIMTFTMAFRVADTSLVPAEMLSTQVNRLFVAAIGCTIAWGFIDAIIGILTSVAARGRKNRLLEGIQASATDDQAQAIVAHALEGELPGIISEEERAPLYGLIARKARTLPVEPEGIRREDVYGALGVMSMAVLATLPAVVPFLLIDDPAWAIRTSNLISVAMLYWVGYTWAKYAGGKPVKMGLLLAGVGLGLIAIAVPLGG